MRKKLYQLSITTMITILITLSSCSESDQNSEHTNSSISDEPTNSFISVVCGESNINHFRGIVLGETKNSVMQKEPMEPTSENDMGDGYYSLEYSMLHENINYEVYYMIEANLVSEMGFSASNKNLEEVKKQYDLLVQHYTENYGPPEINDEFEKRWAITDVDIKDDLDISIEIEGANLHLIIN